MVKIERISPGATVTIERAGIVIPVYEKQFINYSDVPTLKVKNGTVLYSIDELEVHELVSPAPAPAPASTPVIKQVAVKQPAKK